MDTFISLIGIVIFVVIIVLAAIVIIQNRRIQNLQKPKYGFLGKPLLAITALFMSVGVLGVLYSSFTQNNVEIPGSNADIKVIVDIDINATGKLNEYEISANPLINSATWGASTLNKFDIYWTITDGGKVTTEVELQKSLDNPSKIIKTFVGESTKVEVTVIYNGVSYKGIKVFVKP